MKLLEVREINQIDQKTTNYNSGSIVVTIYFGTWERERERDEERERVKILHKMRYNRKYLCFFKGFFENLSQLKLG